jgi:hypothetical protein
MKNEMNPQESLQVITQMIQNTQENMKSSTVHFLWWGWLVLIASVSHYVLLAVVDYNQPYIAWPFLMMAGGIGAGIIGYRQKKRSPVRTHLDRSISYIWGGFVIFLLILLGGMPFMGFEFGYPLMMCLWALGSFITGGVIQFRPLIVGGIVCWALGIMAFFVPFEYQLVLMAAAITACYLVPGYMLKRA